MAKLSLAEAVRCAIDTGDPEVLSKNVDMQDYVSEMKDIGADVISGLSLDEFAGAVSFMQSSAIAEILHTNPMLAMMIMSQQDDYASMMTEALKIAIGIILSEEWR